MKLATYAHIIVLGSLMFLSSCRNIQPKEIVHFEEIEKYYNKLIPDNFPQFNLNDSLYSIVIWNFPNQYSYLIDTDTIYLEEEAKYSFEIVDDNVHTLRRFRASDSTVGYPYVSSDFDKVKGMNYSQLNFYEPEFYASSPDNSKLDYLPVLIHEIAHMTEREEPDSLLDRTDEYISPFELFIYFESDSVFRSRVISENKLLLKALVSPKEDVSEIISEYFKIQSVRKISAPDSLMKIEPTVEASEGYGRYMEYLCKKNVDSLIVQKLTGFEISVPSYELTSEKWMSDAAIGNAYMYATGFNKIRVLRKHYGDHFLKIYSGTEEKNLDNYLKKLH